ncbi:hypothetical protein M3Y98_01213500 [Aphelenchoides besseyi]|nr:hypothetical protein M3Y98_01213500 [Aphelenchoides besseyi]
MRLNNTLECCPIYSIIEPWKRKSKSNDQKNLKPFRATNRFFKNTIDVANQLHSTRMEENEHSAIFHVYALRTASRLFPQNRSFDGMINSIFHDLTRHFQKNYDSVPLKLGNMILMLTILERATATLSDFVTLLYINGYNPVLSKLSGEETPVKPI